MAVNKKFTPTQIKKAIGQAKISSKDKQKLPAVKESMTASLLGKILSPLNRTDVQAVMFYLTSMGTPMKKGGKVKRKPAGKNKIAKVMKSSKRKKK